MCIKERADIIVGICNGILLLNNQVTTPVLTGPEWDEVLEMASSQGVLPIVIQQLNQANPKGGTPMEKQQLLNWIGIALLNEQSYKQRLHVMRKLARLLGEGGIDILFLKGASLAQLYPNPAWRVFSDVDYYLFGKSKRGIELLAQNGVENSAYYHHHTQASLQGVLIENHYDFVERINHKCDVALDDALKALAEKEGHTLRAEFLGEDVSNAYLMTPTMNAIFLMRHMSAHFVSESISMRMLYDWALFLKKYAAEVDWVLVTQLYEQSGMTKFVEIIMTILKNRLEYECTACPVILGGLEMADKVWESIVNPPAKDPHPRFSLRYYLFEARLFRANKWKHKLVYPVDSHARIFLKYTWLGTKKMLGLLRID